MKLFHICTIANKLDQYEEMKESFTQAGFDESKCRHTCLSKYKFLQFLGSKRLTAWFFSKKYVRRLVTPHV